MSNSWPTKVLSALCSAPVLFSGANVHAQDPNINNHTSVIPREANEDSVVATGGSTSADGRFVVFSTASSNLVANDNNGEEDVFLYDRISNEVQLVSRAPNGETGNAASHSAAISADGSTVVFETSATNLYDDNNGGTQDVVVYRRNDQSLTLANTDDPGQQSESAAKNPSLSADGRYVAFDSRTALVAEAVDGTSGVYVRDTWNNTTSLASRTPTGAFPNADATHPAISADGSKLAYLSQATDIAAGANPVNNVYYINLATLETQLVTSNADADSFGPAISGNGDVVAFHSAATTLAPQDFNGAWDVFVWDATLNSMALVSRAAGGESAAGNSSESALDETGNLVVYTTAATDLLDNDTNGVIDVVLHNRSADSNEQLSVDENGTANGAHALHPSISADGNTSVFWSDSTSANKGEFGSDSRLLVRNLFRDVPQPSLVSALLPSSRSAQTDQSVTVFATMVADQIGNECGIELASSIDASIWYQRTDPATNALIGSPNSPVYMRPGVPMSFAIGITGFTPLEPTEVFFNYVCNTGSGAPVVGALNTLLFSVSDEAPQDIVALSATLGGDGIVRIPDDESFGVFSVANVNLGTAGNVTASVSVLGTPLEEVLLCPTVFETGACIEAPSQINTTFLGANGTASYGIFVRASYPVDFRPDENRVVVLFTDDNGVVRGRTSVAVAKP